MGVVRAREGTARQGNDQNKLLILASGGVSLLANWTGSAAGREMAGERGASEPVAV